MHTILTGLSLSAAVSDQSEISENQLLKSTLCLLLQMKQNQNLHK